MKERTQDDILRDIGSMQGIALDKKRDCELAISKTLLTVSATIFSIVISLNLVLQGNLFHNLFFLLGVLLNTGFLLLQVFAIHRHTDYYNQAFDSLEEERLGILRAHPGEAWRSTHTRLHLSYAKKFSIAQTISYALFILMIIAYAAFALTKVDYTICKYTELFM